MSVLSDTTIRKLVGQNRLVLNGDPEFAKHCAYEFKAGRIVYGGIAPPAQQVTAIDLTGSAPQTAIIPPSGVAWVRSREQVEIPANIAGIWIQTNSLSRRGLLLLNSTLVEPGYTGHLSAHFVNLGSSPVSPNSNTTIAKIVFVQLDADATELVDSSPFRQYDAMIDGLAAQSTRSFLRIGELVPDLHDAAASSVAEAQQQIKSLAKDSIDGMKESLIELRKETFLKVGGGFAIGFLLAVAFALWIFPQLRDIDIESRGRIAEIVLEENAELAERLDRLQNTLSEIESSIPNPHPDTATRGSDVAQ